MEVRLRRHLQPKLIEFFDEKLKDDPEVQSAFKSQNVSYLKRLTVKTASTLVGIHEIGNNHGTIVELIQKTCGGKPGDPYCMFTVQSVIAYVELKMNVVSSLWASGSCADVRVHTPILMWVKGIPGPGSIVIWKHDNGKGHTGIVVDANEKTFHAVEGNTSASTSELDAVTREGQGFHFTKRAISGGPNMKVMGFIEPFWDKYAK